MRMSMRKGQVFFFCVALVYSVDNTRKKQKPRPKKGERKREREIRMTLSKSKKEIVSLFPFSIRYIDSFENCHMTVTIQDVRRASIRINIKSLRQMSVRKERKRIEKKRNSRFPNQ